MPSLPLPYSPTDEVIEPDEAALFERLAAVMRGGGKIARDGAGPGGRLSHVKALAGLKGRLEVLPDLPPELAQGVFAPAGAAYDVVARLSHLPAEHLDDRGVSSPRGLALKLLGVPGEPLPGHDGGTQDFVLETAPAFNVATPRAFLAAISTVELAAPLPQPVKAAVSAAARGVNAVLDKVGAASANLDVLGHPRLHPLAERFYSQAPLRWGAYVAKLAAFPDPEVEALKLETDGPEAMREAVAAWFAGRPAVFTIAAQLRTDPDTMPIEDASVVWPESSSPYRPVGRLTFPPQASAAPARLAAVDALAFGPAHGVEAHRPLGGIMRSRLYLYRMLGRERRQVAGQTVAEPAMLADIPD